MSEQRYFYLIAPLANTGVRANEFTYHSEVPLKTGSLVKIPLGHRTVYGLVMTKVKKPSFTTKRVSQAAALAVYPQHLVDLARWMSEYYAAPLSKTLKTMIPRQPFLTRKSPMRVTIPPKKEQKISAPKLTRDQARVVKQILGSKARNFLLHGATGSGKTEVYLHLVESLIAKNRSCIILVPEIALTPQLEQEFRGRFSNQIIVTHSGLTDAKRRNIWQQCLSSVKPIIVIGPRSTLFLPLPHLGLIVIDEAHEQTYKQEQTPRYHTTSVAAELARLTQAKLVLGTATPSTADVFLAHNNRLELAELPQPVFKSAQSKLTVVNLKDKANFISSQIISKPLLDALKETASRGKQSILFMNRRGSARLCLCANCGWSAICPNCGIPLTLHADKGQLLCHWCDYRTAPLPQCPDCGRLEIRFLGSGTKRIETEIKRLLPQTRVVRLDKDSFDPKTIEKIYQQLKDGKIDILIGTQMIAKGLDLPNVETIGVVLADTMLFMPDYTASERTYQLLHQVAGRAGRRESSKAHVIIQSYSPDHPAIQAASKLNFKSFMTNELEERRLLNYPPYVYLLKLECTRASRVSAQKAADSLAKQLEKLLGIQVVGPAPSFRETLRGKYHWQIIVKSKKRSKLVTIANELPSGWTHDIDPTDLL